MGDRVVYALHAGLKAYVQAHPNAGCGASDPSK
jgi:hypothetical protein